MLKIFIFLFKLFFRFLYFFIKLLPVGNKVSFISRQFSSENEDFVCLERDLSEIPKFKNWKFVSSYRVVYDNAFSIIGYIPTMLKQMWMISTSKIVILDGFCIPISILKHKESLVVVQLWHGVGLMKKAGFSVLGSNIGRNQSISTLLNMHRGYSYILANSLNSVDSLFKVFGYGLPKGFIANNDNTHNSSSKTIATPYLKTTPNGIANPIISRPPRFSSTFVKRSKPSDKYKVLYSPTIKKDIDLLEKHILELNEVCNEKGFELVVRPHPHNGLNFSKELKQLVNVQESKTSLEIARKCSFVIVDYSSLIFELIYEEIPVVFFPYDLGEYEKRDALFIDYRNEIPGNICLNGKEVVDSFTKIDTRLQREFFLRYVDLNAESVAIQLSKLL